ncbi:ECF transporter S component [uncultured Limosilactobacillus sp.]|uniref:ECF transporter S component n=1 Tax=uncultured Limosilactobacillus sp. TaxID=2837629 RepID=UPI0025EF5F1C|nr:ECF transporter S component [uncultured Limosilactobacillus sp.]
MHRNNNNLQKTVFGALLIAISVVLGRLVLIPIPMTKGNINLCDLGIFIGSLLLGPWYGLVIGGFSGMLLDLFSGYTQYMFFSFIAHGLEGFAAGWLYQKTKSKSLALSIGVLLMVASYFLADWYLSKTLLTGLLSIGTNLIQGIVGAIIAVMVERLLEKRLHL